MSITEGTVDVLRKFTKLMNCPLCGKDSNPVESLTSCGHYLCSKCVQSFVLSSENKCPNCYAINCRNDCRDNIFINNAIKITHKLVKLIDKTTTNQSATKEVTERLATKSIEEPKKDKTIKELTIESLKSCVENRNNNSLSVSTAGDLKVDKNMSKVESKCVSKFQELDDDVLSIPDSFDNELFTQTSKSADNTQLVSVILEGLESNCDRSSQDLRAEKGSGDEPKSVTVKSSAQKAESKSCNQHLSEVGVQTSQRYPKTVLQSVSIQCSVTQKDQSIQTIKEVVTSTFNSDADCCQSNNCCFHKFVESIPCNSLKTFLKTLVELKVSPIEDNRNANKTEPSVPLPLFNNERTTVSQKKEHSVKEPLKLENQLKPNEGINSEDKSIAEVIPTVVETSKAKKHTKTQPTRRQSTEDKKGCKRVSIQSKNKSKKMKPIESSDEEPEKLDFQESEPPKPIVLKEPVIQIDSSVGTSQSSVTPVEEIVDKIKSKIKGPKSRQKIETNSSLKKVCAEPSNKTKKPKVYVSSDEEMDEDFETQEFETNNTFILKNKSNRKTLKNKPQDSKTIEKPFITDSTADGITIVEKPNKNSKQTARRTLTTVQNKSTKSNVEQLAEKSNIENVYHFSDDQKNESIDTKQKTKRKSVPKKRFPIEESEDFDTEPEVNSKNTNKSKKQNEDKQKNTKHTEEEDKPKVAKYKPKPKSKQKFVLSIDNESDKEVFKRPASPSPSITISDTSSSSRSRSSSNERQKHIILFSGLDEKQKKKIEKVCRELNGEVVTDWTDKVTHLVISLADDRPKKEMICPRNAKYIKALLNNNWIVSFDWITDSSRSNRWVDETNYEIKGDKTASENDLPNKSRNSGEKLFAKRMFKFDDKIGSLLTDFQEFVRIGGGIVVDSEEEFDRMKSKTGCERLIVVNQSISIPNTQKDGIKYVNQKAFMTSISNFNPI